MMYLNGTCFPFNAQISCTGKKKIFCSNFRASRTILYLERINIRVGSYLR